MAKYFTRPTYSFISSSELQISQVGARLQILRVETKITELTFTNTFQCDITKRNYQDVNFKKDFGSFP